MDTERSKRRGSRGTNRGRGLHCCVCGEPATSDPCSPECRVDLAFIQGRIHDYPEEIQ